jgi:hypothetical protein
MHPLRNLPITLALPFLSYFYNPRKEESKSLVTNDELKKSHDNHIINMATQIASFGVIHDTDSESDDFELEEGEDPMGRLGAGIISYFTLVKLIFFLLGLAVLANIPTLISYRTREHLSMLPKYESFAFRNSIGHLGVRQ